MAAFAQVCGFTVGRRPDVTKAVWAYAKAKELQKPSDRRRWLCDAALSAVFGGERYEKKPPSPTFLCLPPHPAPSLSCLARQPAACSS